MLRTADFKEEKVSGTFSRACSGEGDRHPVAEVSRDIK